jgi:hypothetical protein
VGTFVSHAGCGNDHGMALVGCCVEIVGWGADDEDHGMNKAGEALGTIDEDDDHVLGVASGTASGTAGGTACGTASGSRSSVCLLCVLLRHVAIWEHTRRSSADGITLVPCCVPVRHVPLRYSVSSRFVTLPMSVVFELELMAACVKCTCV